MDVHARRHREVATGRARSVAKSLFGLKMTDGIIGDFTINDKGDTSLNPITIYQQKAGKLNPLKTIVPAKSLTSRARRRTEDATAPGSQIARRRHESVISEATRDPSVRLPPPGERVRHADRSRRSSSACCSSGSIVNFVKGPADFMTVFFIGLTNGAVYALVALGYTLVYGILELINFAHGDVFMLGGMISATIHHRGFDLEASASIGSLVARDPRLARRGDGHLRAAQRDDRARRLQAVTQRAATCAADHRDRDVVHPPGHRARVERARVRLAAGDPAAAARSSTIGGVVYTWNKLIVVIITVPVLHRAHVARAEHEAGQGDARDRPGQGRRGDDGHQRQPHDLVHVPDRGRARRRGRPALRALLHAGALRPGLPARADRVHRRGARRHRQPARAPCSARS